MVPDAMMKGWNHFVELSGHVSRAVSRYKVEL